MYTEYSHGLCLKKCVKSVLHDPYKGKVSISLYVVYWSVCKRDGGVLYAWNGCTVCVAYFALGICTFPVLGWDGICMGMVVSAMFA